MGVAGLIHGPDTGHLSEYGGRDDEDVAPREHDAAILKKNLREHFEEAKFETGKLAPRGAWLRQKSCQEISCCRLWWY